MKKLLTEILFIIAIGSGVCSLIDTIIDFIDFTKED